MILYVENKKGISGMFKYLFILKILKQFNIPGQLSTPELSVYLDSVYICSLSVSFLRLLRSEQHLDGKRGNILLPLLNGTWNSYLLQHSDNTPW